MTSVMRNEDVIRAGENTGDASASTMENTTLPTFSGQLSNMGVVAWFPQGRICYIWIPTIILVPAGQLFRWQAAPSANQQCTIYVRIPYTALGVVELVVTI